MQLRCDFQFEKLTNLQSGLERVVLNQQHPCVVIQYVSILSKSMCSINLRCGSREIK